MTTGQIIRELESVEERYRNEKLFTGEVSRSAMAYDCRKKIEKLAEYEDLGEPEELQRKSEWISVEDRLPEAWKDVAVLLEGENNTRAGWYDGDVWFDTVGKLREGVVTHWQPLPEPPKGE